MKKIILLMVLVNYGTFLFSKKYEAHCTPIPPEVQLRMKYSWNDQSPVLFSDLRYITLSHYNFEKEVQKGELIVHKEVAHEVIEIFRQLFEIEFPIRKMWIIDEYNGSDFYSIVADNSYSHCARKVAGSDVWSNHAYGLAIDINPWENPCLHGWLLKMPPILYFDRQDHYHGIITPETDIYRIFKSKGWEWGGECFGDNYKDYHHFHKIISGINSNENIKEPA